MKKLFSSALKLIDWITDRSLAFTDRHPYILLFITLSCFVAYFIYNDYKVDENLNKLRQFGKLGSAYIYNVKHNSRVSDVAYFSYLQDGKWKTAQTGISKDYRGREIYKKIYKKKVGIIYLEEEGLFQLLITKDDFNNWGRTYDDSYQLFDPRFIH